MADLNKYTDIEQYAKQHHVPIIERESIEWLDTFFHDKKVKNILEIGGAIGYSSLMFTEMTGAGVITIERDEARFEQAQQNFKTYDTNNKIKMTYDDANSEDFYQLAQQYGPYDLLFIDATKRQNQVFFEKFEQLVNHGGYIITDNLNFHGLTDEASIQAAHRRIRPMLRAINAYKEWLRELDPDKFQTQFIEVGDTLAITKKL